MKYVMRWLAGTAFTAGALGSGFGAGAVRAEPPVDQLIVVTGQQVNPCTGQLVEAELNFNIRRIDNRQSSVWVVRTETSSDDGWSGGGSDTLVFNRQGSIESVNLRIESPDGEHFFVVKHLWKFDSSGEPEMLRDTIECRR